MYNHVGVTGAAGAAATLPFTGAPVDAIWLGLGGFALFAAGLAVWRCLPRREK